MDRFVEKCMKVIPEINCSRNPEEKIILCSADEREINFVSKYNNNYENEIILYT